MSEHAWWVHHMRAQITRIQPTLTGRIREDIEDYVVQARYALTTLCSLCESPIEQIMCIRLWAVVQRWPAELRVQQVLHCGSRQFRVDFLVEVRPPAGEAQRIVVECDGHEFHEKTKQRAARDKARDRALQLQGVQVFRFTGSEIWNDPEACSDEIDDAIYRIAAPWEYAEVQRMKTGL